MELEFLILKPGNIIYTNYQMLKIKHRISYVAFYHTLFGIPRELLGTLAYSRSSNKSLYTFHRFVVYFKEIHCGLVLISSQVCLDVSLALPCLMPQIPCPPTILVLNDLHRYIHYNPRAVRVEAVQ
jgi:hypothetical protein